MYPSKINETIKEKENFHFPKLLHYTFIFSKLSLNEENYRNFISYFRKIHLSKTFPLNFLSISNRMRYNKTKFQRSIDINFSYPLPSNRRFVHSINNRRKEWWNQYIPRGSGIYRVHCREKNAQRDNERVYIARRASRVVGGRFSGSTTTFQGVDVRWNIISIFPEHGKCTSSSPICPAGSNFFVSMLVSPRTPLKRAPLLRCFVSRADTVSSTPPSPLSKKRGCLPSVPPFRCVFFTKNNG